MFILKCLVDNYTNSKGNKLYACFVDFKRAFYTVIHPGMRIKMLKSDIGKHFYHLIKHMYTLNKLRVKVDSKLGQCFNSHIGDRKGCFETFPFQFIYTWFTNFFAKLLRKCITLHWSHWLSLVCRWCYYFFPISLMDFRTVWMHQYLIVIHGA